VKIRNRNGTADKRCSCGTWKQHWMNVTGRRWPKTCGVLGCRNDAELGAHVQLDDGRSKERWYILPMCRPCNGKKHNLEAKMDKRYYLAWARKSKTCDKYFES